MNEGTWTPVTNVVQSASHSDELQMPIIALQSAEAQTFFRHDLFGQPEHRFAWFEAAPRHADVDFDRASLNRRDRRARG